MKILYFDTETIWFSPPAIIQLWWIEEEWNWRLVVNRIFDPQLPISPQASVIHWLKDKDVEWKPKFGTIVKQFVKATNEADYICWHNIQFDFKALFFEIDRLYWWAKDEDREKIEKWKIKIREKSICTMKESIELCKLPWKYWKYKRPKLSELHIHLFWEDFDWAHDAIADTEATRRCFLEMVEMWIIKISEKKVDNKVD